MADSGPRPKCFPESTGGIQGMSEQCLNSFSQGIGAIQGHGQDDLIHRFRGRNLARVTEVTTNLALGGRGRPLGSCAHERP